MIKYILAGHLKTGHNSHKFENIRELSEDEIERFRESVHALIAFDRTYSTYEMCEENFLAIENYYQELSLLRGGNQLTFHNVVIKWNTLTLNYLASFRMFIDHHETTLERNDDPVKNYYEQFKERTAYHFDKYFSYRFLWNLRNYIQHCGLPACSWEFSEAKEGPKKDQSQVEIKYNREGLLKGFDWKKIKADIKCQPPQIDVIKLIWELKSSIYDIAHFVFDLQRMKLQEPFIYLTSLINEVKDKFPSSEPNILIWDIPNEKGTNPSAPRLLHFPLRIITNIKEVFPDLM